MVGRDADPTRSLPPYIWQYLKEYLLFRVLGSYSVDLVADKLADWYDNKDRRLITVLSIIVLFLDCGVNEYF